MRAEAYIFPTNHIDPLNQNHVLAFKVDIPEDQKDLKWSELMSLFESAWGRLKAEYKEKIPFELV